MNFNFLHFRFSCRIFLRAGLVGLFFPLTFGCGRDTVFSSAPHVFGYESPNTSEYSNNENADARVSEKDVAEIGSMETMTSSKYKEKVDELGSATSIDTDAFSAAPGEQLLAKVAINIEDIVGGKVGQDFDDLTFCFASTLPNLLVNYTNKTIQAIQNTEVVGVVRTNAENNNVMSALVGDTMLFDNIKNHENNLFWDSGYQAKKTKKVVPKRKRSLQFRMQKGDFLNVKVQTPGASGVEISAYKNNSNYSIDEQCKLSF